MNAQAGYNNGMNWDRIIEVGDLVKVVPSSYTLRDEILTGIVIKKMKTCGFFIVYHNGIYHQNVHLEEMEKYP